MKQMTHIEKTIVPTHDLARRKVHYMLTLRGSIEIFLGWAGWALPTPKWTIRESNGVETRALTIIFPGFPNINMSERPHPVHPIAERCRPT